MMTIREWKRGAIRYWERGRLFYNGALVIPALLGYSMGATGQLREGEVLLYGWEIVALLFFLCALPANLCYSFCYVLEFVLASDSEDTGWVQIGRHVALVVGTLLGMALAVSGGMGVAMMCYGE